MKRTWLTLVLLGLGLAAWLVTARVAVSRPAFAADRASHLWVAPPSFAARLPVWAAPGPGLPQAETMAVGNDGLSAGLRYTITVYPGWLPAGIVTWLAVTPTQGMIPPGGQVPVSVTFAAQEGMPSGLYQATVYVDSDGQSEPITVPVPVFLELLDTVLEVAPPALTASLFAGQVVSLPVTIHNLATVDLPFAAGVQPPVPWLRPAPAGGTLPAAAQSRLWAVLDARGLAPGAHQANLVLESSLLPGSAITIPAGIQVHLWSHHLPIVLRARSAAP